MHTYAYDVVGVRYDTLIGLVHRKNSCGVPAAGGELKNTSYPGASTRVINNLALSPYKVLSMMYAFFL
jgi:hypothetical protein